MSEGGQDRTGLSKPFRKLLSRKLRSSKSKTPAETGPVVRLSDALRSSADTNSDRILAADEHDTGQVASTAPGYDPYVSDLLPARSGPSAQARPSSLSDDGPPGLVPVNARQAPHLSVMHTMRDSPASISPSRRPVKAQDPWNIDNYGPRISRTGPASSSQTLSDAGPPSGHHSQGQGQQQQHRQRHSSDSYSTLPPDWGSRHTNNVHSLANGVSMLAKQVIRAGSRRQKGDAILKLYAVISQAAWVTQRGLTEEWTAIYFGLLQIGLARFIKHAAGIVVRPDKGFNDLVRAMAASILKTVSLWIERELVNVTHVDRQTAVIAALEGILTDTHMPSAQSQGGGPHQQHPRSIPENGVDDAFAAGDSILDTQALQGVLDDRAFSQYQDARGATSANSVMETGLLGSLMDTASLEAMMQGGGGYSHMHSRIPQHRRGILDTQFVTTGSELDTQDFSGQILQHKGAVRATFWLFKADQPDGWYAAASFIGSIASLGLKEINAINGAMLVRPLMWLLKNGDASAKYASMRALMFLTDDALCRTAIGREDKYLRELVRTLASGPAEAQWTAATTLAIIVADDPSTHWVLTQARIVEAMVAVLKNPTAPVGVKADVTLGLKHLTASSQRNRDALVAADGLLHLIPLLKADSAEAQYNTARILRHLALGSPPEHKAAALPAIVPLVETLKVARPRVCFACAAALAMLTEGHPEVCQRIEAHDGIAALVGLLATGGGQGKKSAAEALQAMAAEDEASKVRIASAGAIRPLVAMVKDGNLQQQAAAAGALQALAYCPSRGPTYARTIAAHDALQPLVDMLERGPVPMCCAAAGALCNLALACPENQIDIVEAGAVPLLVRLLTVAQPDGQYSAAAALFNLASYSTSVQELIIAADALPALLPMLTAESWYCRIVAAEVLAVLLAGTPASPQSRRDLDALYPLMDLLTLQHRPGALEEAHTPVAHLAYERNEDVIVMKGYKFARANVASAAALACMALGNEQVAIFVAQEVAVVQQLLCMLQSRSSDACRTAAATIADLALSGITACEAILQAPVLPELVSLLARSVANLSRREASGTLPNPIGLAEGATAAEALRVLASLETGVASQIVSLGGVQHLLKLVKGSRSGGAGGASPAPAAQLLVQLAAAVPSAKRAVVEADAETLITHLAQDAPAMPHAMSATLLFARLRNDYSGFAITAKPSANLYILLQVPFDNLLPLEASPPQPQPQLDALVKGSATNDAGTRSKPLGGTEEQRQRVRNFLDRRAAKENHPQPNGARNPPLGPANTRTLQSSDGLSWAAGRSGQALTPATQRDILETWLEY